MIRKSKMYSRPRKAFQSARIKEENELQKKYALKNKKEVWKTQAKVDYFRHRAKDLANAEPEEQELFFAKLRALGLNTKTTADVLGLQIESLLSRRLPTILVAKKLATTPQQARQMVSHKRVMIEGRAVNIPSYIVPVAEESKITLKPGAMPSHPKKSEKQEEESEESDDESEGESQ